MNPDEIIPALYRLSVETGSLACLGCGREHNCGTHGCAILHASADLLESQQARITELEDQLAESQRRERAAVEDLYTACRCSPCNSGICVKKNCIGNIIPCEFEWRGPQEAGEEEAE